MDGREIPAVIVGDREIAVLQHIRLAVLADMEHRYDKREELINEAIAIMSDIVSTE